MSDTPAAQYRHGHDKGGTVNVVRQQKDGDVHSCDILIGCENSATVRDAFRRAGHKAVSNDILPTGGDPRWHIQGCVRDALRSRRWRLVILHIPCTAMAVCGNRTYAPGGVATAERLEAIEWSLETVRIALEQTDYVVVENPASVIFPHLRKMGGVVQYVQPWQHGHPEQKKTGLAIFGGLPLLTPTDDVYDYMMTLPRKERERIFYMSPSDDRGLRRSDFYVGIADAFADQWGGFLNTPKGITPDYSLQGIPYAGNRITGTYAENRISGLVHDTRGDLPKALAASDVLTFHSTDVSPEAEPHHGA